MTRSQILLAALAFALILALYLIWDIVVIFLLSFFAAYLLNPEVQWLERKTPLGRFPIILILFTVVGLILLLLAILLSSQLFAFYQQLLDGLRDLPALEEQLNRWLPSAWTSRVMALIEELKGGGLTDHVIESIQAHTASAISTLQQGWFYLGIVIGQTYGFVRVLINMVVFLFATLYLLRDYEKVINGVLKLIPERYHQTVTDIGQEVDQTLKAFIRGHAVVCLIIGVLYGTGYLLVGISGGFVIGFFGGLINFIPYLGPSLAFLTAAIMALFQYGLGLHLIGVILVFTIVQSLEGNILTPRIVGGAVGLHPVTAIFSLMVFGKFLGFLGLLIALPAAAIFQILLLRAVSFYKKLIHTEPRDLGTVAQIENEPLSSHSEPPDSRRG